MSAFREPTSPRIVPPTGPRDARSWALGLVAAFCLVAAVVVARAVAAPWAGWVRLVLGGLAIVLAVWSLRRRGAHEDDLRKLR